MNNSSSGIFPSLFLLTIVLIASGFIFSQYLEARNQVAGLNAQVSKLEQTISSLKAEIDQVASQIQAKEAEIQRLRAQLGAVEQQRDQAASDVNALRESFKTATGEIAALRENLAKVTAERDAYLNQMNVQDQKPQEIDKNINQHSQPSAVETQHSGLTPTANPQGVLSQWLLISSTTTGLGFILVFRKRWLPQKKPAAKRNELIPVQMTRQQLHEISLYQRAHPVSKASHKH